MWFGKTKGKEVSRRDEVIEKRHRQRERPSETLPPAGYVWVPPFSSPTVIWFRLTTHYDSQSSLPSNRL